MEKKETKNKTRRKEIIQRIMERIKDNGETLTEQINNRIVESIIDRVREKVKIEGGKSGENREVKEIIGIEDDNKIKRQDKMQGEEEKEKVREEKEKIRVEERDVREEEKMGDGIKIKEKDVRKEEKEKVRVEDNKVRVEERDVKEKEKVRVTTTGQKRPISHATFVKHRTWATEKDFPLLEPFTDETEEDWVIGTNLTILQDRFIDEYLKDGNGPQAAGRAKCTAPYQYSNYMLNQPKIRNEINKRRRELKKEVNISQERIMEEFARIAFFDIRNTFDKEGNIINPANLDEDTARALTSLDTKQYTMGTGENRTMVREYRMVANSKLKALDSLCRVFGLYEDGNKLSIELTLGSLLKKLPEELALALKQKLMDIIVERKQLVKGRG